MELISNDGGPDQHSHLEKPEAMDQAVIIGNPQGETNPPQPRIIEHYGSGKLVEIRPDGTRIVLRLDKYS